MGDSEQVSELFEAHIPLADRIAARYSTGYGTDDDVLQVARTGLLLAARRFDPDKGVFVRYATVTIVGEIKKHARQTGWAVSVPRSLQEDALRVGRATDELWTELSRAPSASEVGERTGMDPSRVVEVLRVREARFTDDYGTMPLGSPQGPDPLDRAMVSSAMADLSREDALLLEMRFSRDMTQAEIGEEVGISQAHVHRRLNSVMERLRHMFESVDV